MKLTQGNKIALIVGFGVLVFGTIIQIGIREWYTPDIRYEEGSYYTSGSTAMTSLKLENFGHGDAEDIIIYAKFNTPLIEISTDNKALTFQNISGGKGQRYVTGKISRLVPQQEIYIYFAIDNSSSAAEESPKKFLAELTFKGGKGKTGSPIWFLIMLMVFPVLCIIVIIIYLMIYLIGREDKKWEKFQTDLKRKMYELVRITLAKDWMKFVVIAKSTGIPKDVFISFSCEFLKDEELPQQQLHKLSLKYYDSGDEESFKENVLKIIEKNEQTVEKGT